MSRRVRSARAWKTRSICASGNLIYNHLVVGYRVAPRGAHAGDADPAAQRCRRTPSATRSKRALSRARGHPADAVRVHPDDPVHPHLADPVGGVPRAASDLDPVAALGGFLRRVPVVVLAGHRQSEQPVAVPADDQHRTVLALGVVLLVRHPGPHHFARVGQRAGVRRVGEVGTPAEVARVVAPGAAVRAGAAGCRRLPRARSPGGSPRAQGVDDRLADGLDDVAGCRHGGNRTATDVGGAAGGSGGQWIPVDDGCCDFVTWANLSFVQWRNTLTELGIAEVLDLAQLQKILEDFSEATGLATRRRRRSRNPGHQHLRVHRLLP